MIWQFGELGYDISINSNGRLGEKPIHWEYKDDADRKALMQVYANLAYLKKKYPVIKEIRGMGLMLGVELDVAGKQIVQAALEHGLLINCTHDKVLRLMPALNVTKKEIDMAMAILKGVFEQANRQK